MHVAIYFPSFGDGGAERMLVNLAVGLAETGATVDFITRRADAHHLGHLTGRVSTHFIGREERQRFLARYLGSHRPQAVIAAKDRALEELVAVRAQGGLAFKLIARPGTNISRRLSRRNPFSRWNTLRRLRRAYARADLVVANSHGVAADIAAITGLDEAAIPVVRNPVITPDLPRLAAAGCAHPWLAGDGPGRVVVGMGGLRHQKGFDVLVRAFAALPRGAGDRLVIFGRGRQRDALQRLARNLGVAERMDLPGFLENPYPCLARARLFVLSSNWEGSPNALTEALALGVPVVSTDCPSGPREILQDGRVAPLVPPGDPAALARAMKGALEAGGDPERLRQSVAEYSQARAAARYRELIAGLVAGGAG